MTPEERRQEELEEMERYAVEQGHAALRHALGVFGPAEVIRLVADHMDAVSHDEEVPF